MKLILASQSPRRRDLIGLLNMKVVAKTAAVDEESVQLSDLRENVLARAELKGRALHSAGIERDEVIIAADTTVALDGAMLNKPNNAVHAREMLLALRGREHVVHTGVVLIPKDGDAKIRFVDTAFVTMRPYSEAEVDTYVQTGDPLDKAGAYAIQHPVFQPVAHLDGCYLTVMGLPVCRLIGQLQQMGAAVISDLEALEAAHQNFSTCAAFAQLKRFNAV